MKINPSRRGFIGSALATIGALLFPWRGAAAAVADPCNIDVYPGMSWTLAQAAYLRCNSRFRTFIGGRGAGKTLVGAHDLVGRVKPDGVYVVMAPNSMMLASVMRYVCDAARAAGLMRVFQILASQNRLTLSNRAAIYFVSGWGDSANVGKFACLPRCNIGGLWMDEPPLYCATVAKNPLGDILPALNRTGWLSATFTPVSMSWPPDLDGGGRGKGSWTYKELASPEARRRGFSVFHSRTADNPYLPPEFADAIRAHLNPRDVASELEGRFID